jgi:hypothetical protein
MELLRMIKRGNWISRNLPKLRYQALNLSTISDIPTEKFLGLVKSLKSEDWDIVDNYYNGGILYHQSRIKLKHRHNSAKLNLEWNNKEGGRIEGADEIIRNIARTHGFIATNDRHWAQKDSFVA